MLSSACVYLYYPLLDFSIFHMENKNSMKQIHGEKKSLFAKQSCTTQSLATDMRRLFYSTWPPSFSSHIKKGEESDDGHRIKRALYIGIKRL